MLLLSAASVWAHGRASSPPADEARRITFPDVEGYQVLVLDPHTHSVFSDSHVWPRIRVEEALHDAEYHGREQLRVKITNTSDVDFRLRNKSRYGFAGDTDLIDVPQHSAVSMRVKTGKKGKEIELPFKVLNALAEPKKTASITLRAAVKAEKEK